MAKRNILIKSITTVGHITRDNLERAGALIDGINAKTGKPRQYKAVDLNDDVSQQDLFREQTLKTTQQLLGPRFATYGKYAKKVVPNSLFTSALDNSFSQIAKLASNWSQLDLPNEHRFADITDFDDEQRYALATDIANQNRALATLGGLTGLAGLPGLLADTLWLLLVSLRTVYQLAAVYDKPLTGKQGIKIAYKLIANADLSKMQEKQALLAGLGVGKGLLDNAQNRGLHNELKNLGLKNKNVNYYAEQVDSIASQIGIDLDKIDMTWLRRFLPLTAVTVGMRYNSQLIDEVIGVARATFAPEPKMANRAITDDSSSEEEVKSSSNDKKGNTQKAEDGQKQSAQKEEKQTNKDGGDSNTKNNSKPATNLKQATDGQQASDDKTKSADKEGDKDKTKTEKADAEQKAQKQK